MQLGGKLALIAFLTVISTMIATFLLLSRGIAGGQVDLSEDLVISQFERLTSSVETDAARLEQILQDLGGFDGILEFPESRRGESEVVAYLRSAGIDAAYIYNHDHGSMTPFGLVNAEQSDGLQEVSSILGSMARTGPARSRAGLLPTSTNLYYAGIGRLPERESGEGHVRDMIVVQLVELRGEGSPVGDLSAIDAVVSFSDVSITPERRNVIRRIQQTGRPEVVERDEFFVLSGLIEGIGGADLLLQVSVPRQGLLIATGGLQSFLPMTLLVGFFIALAFTFMLLLVVERPLSTILHFGDSTMGPGHRSVGEQMRRRDQFGRLARLVRRLRDSVIRTEEASRRHGFRSGMEEMAGAILHNVGNALTPVVVGVDRIIERLKHGQGTNLETIAKELADPGTPDDRREKLLQYLSLADKRQEEQEAELNQDLRAIASQVGRVEEMLASRELLEPGDQILEPVDIGEVIRGAVSSLPMKLQGVADVKIDEALNVARPVVGAKLELIQIFLNLLCNAAESIEARAARDGMIRITGEVMNDEGAELLHLEFNDNGSGVSREELPFIFEQGFTTKDKAMGGSGLAWCALALSKMEGRIYAESDGPGRGVTFHIMLPIHVPREPELSVVSA